MKKFLMIGAMIMGAQSAMALETMDAHQAQLDDGGAIVGGIIGGIIGGVIGGQIGGGDHGDHGHGGHGGPYYPGHGGDHDRGMVCYARNGRGEVFRAFGRSGRWAQNEAMNRCYEVSRNCRPMGCQY